MSLRKILINSFISLPKFPFYLDGKDLQQFGDGREYAWGFRSLCTWSIPGYFSHYFDKDI